MVPSPIANFNKPLSPAANQITQLLSPQSHVAMSPRANQMMPSPGYQAMPSPGNAQQMISSPASNLGQMMPSPAGNLEHIMSPPAQQVMPSPGHGPNYQVSLQCFNVVEINLNILIILLGNAIPWFNLQRCPIQRLISSNWKYGVSRLELQPDGGLSNVS